MFKKSVDCFSAVTKAALSVGVSKMMESDSSKALESLFAGMDDNGDGTLSCDEIRGKFDELRGVLSSSLARATGSSQIKEAWVKLQEFQSSEAFFDYTKESELISNDDFYRAVSDLKTMKHDLMGQLESLHDRDEEISMESFTSTATPLLQPLFGPLLAGLFEVLAIRACEVCDLEVPALVRAASEALCKQALSSALPETIISALFQLVDTDSSGSLSWDELERATAVFSPELDTEGRFDALISVFDADSSGTLDLAELREMVTKLGGFPAILPCCHLVILSPSALFPHSSSPIHPGTAPPYTHDECHVNVPVNVFVAVVEFALDLLLVAITDQKLESLITDAFKERFRYLIILRSFRFLSIAQLLFLPPSDPASHKILCLSASTIRSQTGAFATFSAKRSTSSPSWLSSSRSSNPSVWTAPPSIPLVSLSFASLPTYRNRTVPGIRRCSRSTAHERSLASPAPMQNL